MTRRLIEESFPLKKVSEDSQHEQYVSQGKPNSLQFWPARRPLAASRAVVLATLLPDPGDAPPEMQAEYTRLAKSTDPAVQRSYLCRLIEGMTRWGTENGPNLQVARSLIRKAYGGWVPRVLDPFAGGGAIPLEAMRLGCAVAANDYNPVAWLILKCTLEYPQRLAGKVWPLPSSGTDEGLEGSTQQYRLAGTPTADGDLAAHIRWWGKWVIDHTRGDLAAYYPTVDSKSTVAYLWARTVPCPDPQCAAAVPLLKTLWLCKKGNKRRALRLMPQQEARRVKFEIWEPGPHDTVPRGTMAGANATCPLCGVQVPEDYIKGCGHASRMKTQMTCVIVDGPHGKEYRSPTNEDLTAAECAAEVLSRAADQIPHGLPSEPLPGPGTLGFRMPLYGFKTWADLFTPRQLLALVTLVKWTRASREEMQQRGYDHSIVDAVQSYLTLLINKVADYNCTGATWQLNDRGIGHLFTGAQLPMTCDFVEANIIVNLVSSYESILDSQQGVLRNLFRWFEKNCQDLQIICGDARQIVVADKFDFIVTDPPYYDAIPYADISDFFFLWNKRCGFVPANVKSTANSLTPKDAELVQHIARFCNNKEEAIRSYTYGMAQAFQHAADNLTDNGHMVVVFAHKNAEAWETLVSGMVEVGFTVTASWPIDTEKGNRSRGMNSAALATSLWLVCRKRPADAGIGRYAEVKRRMQGRITERLRYFWDHGIAGPDLVWAAVGPALESYSAYREVRRMDGTPFTVGEFLREVRRLVTDFALGQILRGASTEGLDEWTRYYLMHRATFGSGPAPVGECILYAQGYGLDLNDLRGLRGILTKGIAGAATKSDEAMEGQEGAGGGSGSDMRLLGFDERKRDDLGQPHPSGGLPMIDMLHYLMRLWNAGDTARLAAYVAEHGLSQNDLFWAVAQALVEQAAPQSKERSLLEALVAWGRGRDTQSLQPALL